MADSKITIRVPSELVEGAKRYERLNRTTLTRLVSEYLRRLSTQSSSLPDAPIVQRLAGSLPQDVPVEEYHEYLEKKYGSQA
jgi:hypothetical protein